MRLVCGIDICNDITQITTISQNKKVPKEFYFDENTKNTWIPTVLYHQKITEEWLVGEDAYEQAQKEQGEVLQYFFYQALQEEEISYDGKTYSSISLMQCYVTGLLRLLTAKLKEVQIDEIMFTCIETTKDNKSIRRFQEVLETCGLSSFCSVQSHLQSFLYYMLHQEERLWKRGTLAFEYEIEGLFCYYMKSCTTKDGMQLIMDYEKNTECLPSILPSKQSEWRECEEKFGSFATSLLQRKPAVSLFITGRGFVGEFAMEQIQAISMTRRAFKGNNLYTQGACYAVADKKKDKIVNKVYMPNEIVVNMMLRVEQGGKEDWLPLIQIGETYIQCKKIFDVIAKGVPEFCLFIQHTSGEHYQIMLTLPDVKQSFLRRYQFRLFFLRRDRCVIQVKDMGFGQKYPTTYRIYEKIIDLSNWKGKI